VATLHIAHCGVLAEIGVLDFLGIKLIIEKYLLIFPQRVDMRERYLPYRKPSRLTIKKVVKKMN